jgi:arginyl-tRNA--protein-N-Asp/Glu arginylyltransferase
MTYLNWDTKIITDFSSEAIEKMYDAGYVFTRVDRGVMNKTRSFRIDLAKFEMTSENRRIAKKSENISLKTEKVPYEKYDWKIGKLAKDFYEKRAAQFSANKIKELLTDKDASNFNKLLVYSDLEKKVIGYAICFETKNISHYSFPFYIDDPREPSRGLGLMIIAMERAKSLGKKFIYLGSLQRPSDTYKLQFKGSEWFDGEKWTTAIEPLKGILKS